VPPDAAIVVLLPAHRPLLPAVTFTATLPTVTATVFVLLQPLYVPVTVYVVDVDGDATTLAPYVELSPVAGPHVYTVAPDAESVALLPLQTVTAVLATFRLKFGLTVTGITLVLEQPAP
jgi:hypothetical protein